jgi:hypothetical protein
MPQVYMRIGPTGSTVPLPILRATAGCSWSG